MMHKTLTALTVCLSVFVMLRAQAPEDISANDLNVTFATTQGDNKDLGWTYDAEAGINVLTGANNHHPTGMFGCGENDAPHLFREVRLRNGDPSPLSVELLPTKEAPWSAPNGKTVWYGLKVGGVGAALKSGMFSDEQKKPVTDIFGEAAWSRLVDGRAGVPLQSDISLHEDHRTAGHEQGAPAVRFAGTREGELYEVRMLVGRGNAYTGLPWDVTYGVTEGEVQDCELIGHPGGKAPVFDKAKKTVRLQTANGGWALIRFQVMAAGDGITVGALNNPGNLRALSVRKMKASVRNWLGTGLNLSWQDAMAWSGNRIPLAVDTVRLSDRPELRRVRYLPPSENPDAVQAAELQCFSGFTRYWLFQFPERIPIRSEGLLTLTNADSTYGHTVHGTAAYVSGQTVTLTGRVTAPVYVEPDTRGRPGHLTVGETAVLDRVTVAEGCTVSGAGTVDTLTVADGAVVSGADGTLRLGTLNGDCPENVAHEWTLPGFAAMPKGLCRFTAVPGPGNAPAYTLSRSVATSVCPAAGADGTELTGFDENGQPVSVLPAGPAEIAFRAVPKTEGVCGARVTALLKVGGKTIAAELEDSDLRAYGPGRSGTPDLNGAVPGDVFYVNPNAAHPLIADGQSVMVNQQVLNLTPANPANRVFWTLDLPLNGAADVIANAYPKMTVSVFRSDRNAAPHGADGKVFVTAELIDRSSGAVCYTSEPQAGTGHARDTTAIPIEVTLKPVETRPAKTPWGCLLRLTYQSDGGQYAGLRSVVFREGEPQPEPGTVLPENIPAESPLAALLTAFAKEAGIAGPVTLTGFRDGRELTVDEMNAAASVLDGIVRRVPSVRTHTAATALEIAYDINIIRMERTPEQVVIAAEFLGADGPATLKPDAEARLFRTDNGTDWAPAEGASAPPDGTVFTLPDAASAGRALFRIELRRKNP